MISPSLGNVQVAGFALYKLRYLHDRLFILQNSQQRPKPGVGER